MQKIGEILQNTDVGVVSSIKPDMKLKGIVISKIIAKH